MVDCREEQLDRLFYALSDKTRRGILLALSITQSSISELGAPFKVSKQSISKHIKVLEAAGLIRKTKEGRIQRCQFNPEKMKEVQSILNQYQEFWEQQFDQLDKYIKQSKQQGE